MTRRIIAAALAVCLLTAITAAADETTGLDAARVHLQKGRYDEALEAYAELAKTDSDKTQIALGISRAHEAAGDYKQAVETVEKRLKQSAKDVLLLSRLAELQFLQGQYAAAEKTVQQAIKVDSEQPLAHLVLADVLAETGRLEQALEEYRWFIRYYNRKQPEDAESLLLVARGASQYARWKGSSQIFSFAVNTLCPDALKDDKLQWQSYYISGSLLLEKYNRAQAIPEFKQALAINPRAADVLVALGNAALQQREFEEAHEFAGRALKVNSNLMPALLLKADVAIGLGKLPQALDDLKTARTVNPNDQRIHGRVAACYLLQDGPPPKAQLEELFSNLDSIEDASIEKPDRFMKLAISVAKRNPHPGHFLAIVGDILDHKRKFDLAERFYKQAIASMPQLSGPKTSLGMLYMSIGRNEDARKLLDSAFDADPFHVRVSNMRKVLGVLSEYKTISTEHFVVRVDSKLDRVLGEYMAEYLEEIYPGLVKQYGFEPPQRTHFEIFNKAKGLSGHQWFSARMIGLPWIQTVGASTGVIVALASPTAVDEPFNWARVLRHEFVHIITLQQTQFNIPHWFTEALAVSSEGYPRPAIWNALLLERVPKGELRTLDNLNDGFQRPKSPLDWQFAYCQSRLYAQYMVEQYGKETIPKLLNAYRNNLTTDQAIPKVFGIDKKTFEARYVKFLNKLVAELKGGTSEPKKTLAELEKAHLAKPDDPKAAGEYALGLFKVRKRKQARELAEKALEKNEAEPSAALVMAQLQLLAEDNAAASEILDTALDRKNPHPVVLALLARIKLREEEFAEAAELFALGETRFPHDLNWTRGLSAAYEKLGETEKLKNVLQILASADPEDVASRKKLAELAFAAGEFENVVKYGRLALHVDVLDSETHRLLGEAHRELKAFPRAVRELQVALELKPADTMIELGLAKAQLAAGRKAEAKTHLKNILKREPEHPAASVLLKKLE